VCRKVSARLCLKYLLLTSCTQNPGLCAAWSFVLWGFLVGIFAVWLYAAIRPRYGDGPKTALCAGAVVWVWAI
jgi:hypothetical protein